DYALEVSLDKPFGPLLHHLAQYGASMVSPDRHRTWKQDYGLHPAGTGPFKLARWARGRELALERFDDGWRGRPGLDQLSIKSVLDDSARLALLESGEVQLAGSVPIDLLAKIRNSPRLRIDTVSTAR